MKAISSYSDALVFAMEAHRGQFRKGDPREAFLSHPIRVAHALVRQGLCDAVLLQAALLHDVLEDTAIPADRIRAQFGEEVLGLVWELTDDKNLLKSVRKQMQVERAPGLSLMARLIRIADKTDNLASLEHAPPSGWSLTRQREYLAWSRRVVGRIRGTHAGLEAEFDAFAEEIDRKLHSKV
ncbi:MAG: bifunctional (p)ppGpp synthetase/guanosine-3',5'-bis(diphosphate) 3'-pyrophosphohydrolase [Verrucomicrobia bacterium]|nr:bifunctional (p)ppGpp synthetase/guanosine-3',5'-bis(diphosphate) 3'-pyrophosphohydrolase [Verrucomicrobiota bacterium]MCH8514445.1 HD domain-containing protein [Kiritimatiellia bacterium]